MNRKDIPDWPEGLALIPNKTKIIIIWPTVNPQVVVVPIVSSIFLFPILALLIICCLRARQKARLQQRDDPYSDRSCASIVNRSPPHSANGIKYDIDREMTTTIEIVTPDDKDSS